MKGYSICLLSIILITGTILTLLPISIFAQSYYEQQQEYEYEYDNEMSQHIIENHYEENYPYINQYDNEPAYPYELDTKIHKNTANVNVQKTISCLVSGPQGSLEPFVVCNTLAREITPNEFKIQVIGNNPNPTQFDAAVIPVNVMIGTGTYVILGTADASVQDTINQLSSNFPNVDILGPSVEFSGDCIPLGNDFSAVGIIDEEGETQTCMLNNIFVVNQVQEL